MVAAGPVAVDWFSPLRVATPCHRPPLAIRTAMAAGNHEYQTTARTREADSSLGNRKTKAVSTATIATCVRLPLAPQEVRAAIPKPTSPMTIGTPTQPKFRYASAIQE